MEIYGQGNGSYLLASSGGPDRSKLPKPSTECRIYWPSLFRRTDYKCGHRGPRSFRAIVYGVKSERIVQNERCPSCFLSYVVEASATCALCGLPILPDDGVVLYGSKTQGLLAEGTRVGDDYLGCMRWDCCPCGGMACGRWSTEGIKPLFD